MSLDPAWIALGASVAGGTGLKFAEHWLGRNRVRIDDASKIRSELRADLESQRKEIKQLEAEVDKWRGQYYDLRDKYTNVQTELTMALAKIKEESAHAENIASSIKPDD